MGNHFSKSLIEELKEIQYQKVFIPQLSKKRQKLAEDRGLNFRINYNVAFVGVAGAGKSSLINAVLRVGQETSEQDYAKTGIVQCTAEITAYCHPVYKYIVLWDIPGGGVLTDPADTYFDDKCLEAFDFLIVVIKDDIVQLDSKIITEANKRKVPFALVRMKMDQAIDNDAHLKVEKPSEESKECVQARFEEKLTRKFQSAFKDIEPNIEPNIYLVSKTGFKCDDPNLSVYRLDELYLLKMVLSISKGRQVAFMISQAKRTYRRDFWMKD